ncbi:MAG: hypothetical protein IJU78_03880 [Clostridia bacterium]|nr:hypothetical protein [Clostridia bacterium]
MEMDLLSIEGSYRGVSRSFKMANVKNFKQWKIYFKLYEEYLEWIAKMDNSYDPITLGLLQRLRDETIKYGTACEIILYSDKIEEYSLAVDILGFDVLGDMGESAIQEGNKIKTIYRQKLNKNGLFSSYTDAEAFCKEWNELILSGNSPWEVEKNPRPFCVWLY